MQLVLTDVLTCPRCGPEFGLIVLADRLEDRRVLEGVLGCSNCRDSYAIRFGLPDLRYPADAEAAAGPPPPSGSDEEAVRLAALLGLSPVPGLVLLAGDVAGLADEMVRVVPEIGVIVVGAGVAALEDHAGVSRLLVGRRLPLRTAALRAVALGGAEAVELLAEAARVVVPGGRIVVDPAPPEAGAELAERGFRVLLQEGSVLVASRQGGR